MSWGYHGYCPASTDIGSVVLGWLSSTRLRNVGSTPAQGIQRRPGLRLQRCLRFCAQRCGAICADWCQQLLRACCRSGDQSFRISVWRRDRDRGRGAGRGSRDAVSRPDCDGDARLVHARSSGVRVSVQSSQCPSAKLAIRPAAWNQASLPAPPEALSRAKTATPLRQCRPAGRRLVVHPQQQPASF